MEKSVEWLDYLEETFELPKVQMETYSPLTLAYIGDDVYDLLVRTVLVKKGNAQTDRLNRQAVKAVKASTQAVMIEMLTDKLTEEELRIYKRGRNAKTVSRAKNATMSEYRRATGFETLMGYLYLTKQYERMIDLVKMGLKMAEVEL